jgi:Fe-S-cluster-containing dehydrogenase component
MSPATRILTKKSLCSGCLSCMSVCSLTNERSVGLTNSRIQVDVDVFGGHNEITICRQCKDPACVKACPVDAIYKDSTLDIWRVDYGRCIGCRECVGACPFSSMLFDPHGDQVIKCELCGASGKPACVEICPTGALQLKVLGSSNRHTG